MQNLEPHEEYLFRNTSEGFVQVKGINDKLVKLVSEGLVKKSHSKSGFDFYKLTKSGWDVIKKAKKS